MYSRISALGLVGHCTSHFKRAVCISCRPRVDVHKGVGGGSGPCGQGEGGSKTRFFCGRHKWMTPCALAVSVLGPDLVSPASMRPSPVITKTTKCKYVIVTKDVRKKGKWGLGKCGHLLSSNRGGLTDLADIHKLS